MSDFTDFIEDSPTTESHVINNTKHREINDLVSGSTNLWSAQKITSELITISGGSGVDQFTELSDTPSFYDDGKYLQSTSSGTEWATVSGKLDDHNELNNLDYASSGHTGFQPAGNYLTETEINTISGALGAEIDSDITIHSADTTIIHGITDTSDLVLRSGSVDQFSDITSVGADIEDAVTKKHEHINKIELDKVTDGVHDVIAAGNPHSVTKGEVGLSNVTNDAQIPLTQKAAANGVASLDADTKIPNAQLPALAISETYVAISEVAQLVLTVQEGDVCVRTDENKSYIALNDDNVDMGDWQELLTPTDAVTSVFGRVGIVTAVQDDYNHSQLNNIGVDDHHNELHSITSHSDIVDATGAQIEELTGGGNTTLHNHDATYCTESEVEALSINNVVEDITPQQGGDLEYNGKNQVFNTTLTSDNTASGDIISVIFGESVTFGQLCYPDVIDNEWKLALGTNGAVKHPAMGVALESKTNGQTGKLLLRGLIRSATYFSGFGLGDILYLSDTTAGSWLNTAPTDTGDIVQIMGWVLMANYGYFNPDYTYVERS